MYDKVAFIEGMVSVDDRGELGFCNDFDMKPVRRLYVVSNHKPKFIRAWHAHKKETKFVSVVAGAALVASVKIDNWKSPDRNAKIYRYALSDKRPGILVIPRGYANGFMTLKRGTKIMIFSDRTLKESKADDYRYDAYYWNPWNITPR
jgi:dTDP-4-dehydrorhamnose 3,5-epimerase